MEIVIMLILLFKYQKAPRLNCSICKHWIYKYNHNHPTTLELRLRDNHNSVSFVYKVIYHGESPQLNMVISEPIKLIFGLCWIKSL